MLLSDEIGAVPLIASDSGTMRSSDGRLWIGLHRSSRRWLRTYFPVIAGGIDGLALFLTAIVTGYLYHSLVFGEDPVFETIYQFGGLISFMVVLSNGVRQEYQIARFLTSKGYAKDIFHLWNMIFLSATALAFLTKTGTTFSRATILLFYATGFLTLLLTRATICRIVQAGSKRGTVSVRRAFLIGTAQELKAFGERYQPWNLGIEIVGVATLDGSPSIDEEANERQLSTDLDRALTVARTLDLDDVFILTPWSENQLIARCVDAFLNLPAAIHLGPERIFDRFDDVRIAKIGPIASLNLVRRPLSIGERIEKRILDIVLSGLGLIALTPVFLALAVAIRLDSPGPMVFRQRRYGFNQKQFTILKFRSMTVLEDGARVTQASRNDRRVTRVGYWLRRLSLDELPQLWNVLLGQMSLVGPRPHALAHDRAYERSIALYARRHNVKPGITGWAQVNGFRGETDTEDKMQHRVRHDLFYIDNWSIWLDLRILALTVLSSKARSNAY